MSRFGFSTEPSEGGGNFLPVCKYDARSGRMFRVDRIDTGNGFVSEQVDITRTFKAQVDLENVETGWILFAAGIAPHFALVPLGAPMPPRPTPDHKNGVRFLAKLGKDCGGDVREFAGTSKAFLSGVEKLFDDYDAGKAQNPGKLPVVEMPDTLAVKSGQSTNYMPVFRIVAWAARGPDFKYTPRGGGAATPAPANAGPAHTGSTRVAAPTARTPEPAAADTYSDDAPF
jgi:hypothetical protein